MATSASFATFLLIIFLSTASTAAPLLSALAKDPKTNQYTATVYSARLTPPKPTKLVLDLGFFFPWVDCKKGAYGSSKYSVPIFCNSSLCASIFNSLITCSNCVDLSEPVSYCSTANESCALFLQNSFSTRRKITTARGSVMEYYSLAFPRTDGRNPGPLATLPRFFLSCPPTSFLNGLAEGASGVLALGRSNFSVATQISAAFSLPNVFALCLSGSPSAPGVAFFATRGPHYFLPGNLDASLFLAYTPLLLVAPSGRSSHEYLINVSSVEVNGNPVRVVLKSTSLGRLGQISTVAPYTVMERSVFRAFTAAFVREATSSMNMTRVERVKPFGACFSSEGIASTKTGPAVPTVDLVLNGENGNYWRIYGANSMVVVKDGVLCLAFVDGGKRLATTANWIVVGGHQMEDNLLQFDLEKERLGFSNSLLLRETTCSNFNFTQNPSSLY